MIHPLEEYKELSKLQNISDIAYQTLFEKYIIDDQRGHAKLTELDSTDNETQLSKVTKGYPIPGMIYTFIYKPLKGDNPLIVDRNTIKEYVDYVPLTFCVNTDVLTFSGINLNTIPNTERLKFLVAYYETYKGYMSDVERLTQNGVLTWNKRFLELAKSGKAQGLIREFNSKMGANFNYGYRKYNMVRVDGLRMIEYEEWKYVSFFDPKNAFRLMNQKQVQGFYWKDKR